MRRARCMHSYIYRFMHIGSIWFYIYRFLSFSNAILCNRHFLFPFDFLVAPEIQLFSNCSILSDMFSLGLLMCTIFNQGHALIQANNSASTYLKQLETVSHLYIYINLFLIHINSDIHYMNKFRAQISIN